MREVEGSSPPSTTKTKHPIRGAFLFAAAVPRFFGAVKGRRACHTHVVATLDSPSAPRRGWTTGVRGTARPCACKIRVCFRKVHAHNHYLGYCTWTFRGFWGVHRRIVHAHDAKSEVSTWMKQVTGCQKRKIVHAQTALYVPCTWIF